MIPWAVHYASSAAWYGAMTHNAICREFSIDTIVLFARLAFGYTERALVESGV